MFETGDLSGNINKGITVMSTWSVWNVLIARGIQVPYSIGV